MWLKQLPIGAPLYGLQGINRIDGGAADPISTTNGTARNPWLFTKVEFRLFWEVVTLVVLEVLLSDTEALFELLFVSMASSIAVK